MLQVSVSRSPLSKKKGKGVLGRDRGNKYCFNAYDWVQKAISTLAAMEGVFA